MPPTEGHGKICYLEIPADDIDVSAKFYSSVFGWRLRTHGDGRVAFDDGVGEVSGTWVLGRPPGIGGALIYIMMDDAEAALASVVAHGGEVVQAIGADAPEITARFRDPAGNVLGIYQNPV
jgi:uncharacterized protein